jgi:quercetin dioxygenase-like cupin family protein
MILRTVRPLFLALSVITVASGLAYAAEPDPAVMSYNLPADQKWTESAEYPGLKSVVLYGDPNKPGPYAVRNRFSPGVMSRPHSHSGDRFILVLSGTWWVGTGDKFDPASTKALPVGSTAVHIAGKVHYDGAKDEACEVIIYGVGPLTTKRAGGD